MSARTVAPFAGLVVLAALLTLESAALSGQSVPPGCNPNGPVRAGPVALGSSYSAAVAALGPPEPGDSAPPAADTTRIRYVGRGMYLGVSADTILSVGLEAPSRVEVCDLRVGQHRDEVLRRWGEPRSRLPSAWIYGDSVGVPRRWVAVVYFSAADAVARISVMLGPGALTR